MIIISMEYNEFDGKHRKVKKITYNEIVLLIIFILIFFIKKYMSKTFFIKEKNIIFLFNKKNNELNIL